ncbi:unnamed protein product [Alopecurus aequalis]
MRRRRPYSPTAASPPPTPPFLLHPERRVFPVARPSPDPPPPTAVPPPAPSPAAHRGTEDQSTPMGKRRPAAAPASRPPRAGQPANAPSPATAPKSEDPECEHAFDLNDRVPESLPSSHASAAPSGSNHGHGSVHAGGGGASPRPRSGKRKKGVPVSWGAKGKRGRGEKSLKFDIQQLPHDMDAMLVKKDVNCELEKDGLMPKVEAKVLSPATEDSVPSSFGSNLVVSSDDKAGEIGEISEHKTDTEKAGCCSVEGSMLSCDSGSRKEEALGDEIQFSRMDGCHENGGLGHQDSSVVELDCPNHLALELNACKSVTDKPCSVVFVKNGNDEELENQKSESSSVSRRRNPRRSASAKNPTPEKHNQIHKGSNSTCKSKKVKSSCSLVESNMIKGLNKITKGRKKNDDSGGKDKKRSPYVKGKSMSKNIAGDIFFVSGSSTSPSQLVIDLAASHTNEHSNCTPSTEVPFENSAVISTGIPRNSACITDGASVSQPPRAAWVCCDDCQKWRCIPADLADNIGETNSRWTCKDNQDKTFAGCSIPQEKTNAEINAELDLSDASADEADNNESKSKASKAPSWAHARINSFPHRNRRNQSIDESMVCNCKPPQDGRMGCRDGCLNRMLNIECEKRTCPCGEQCSNQQFQRRIYAKISWFHSGKKGYGLRLKEDVSEGRFLIEYVGEVLDITAYESRQSYYASKGQKHFYFMALNGGEVIDACTKGNLGRFINHSCSPNCRTEKWMVNGEVCIGIFAMRKIKKGEELTFDYNYVRVSGAAPQKCFCGTAKCRGYIGGEISGSAQDDAETEQLEPMVTNKDAEEMLGNAYCSHGANPNIVEHETSIQREDSNNCPPATPDSEPYEQTLPILSDTSEANNSMEAWSPQEAEDVTRTPVHVSRTTETPLQQFPVCTQPLKFLEKTPNTIDEMEVPNVMNKSTPSSALGSILVPGYHVKKTNTLKQNGNVKPPCPIGNEHTLGVEGRLNSLLDKNGGISRRKDSTNEYLRFLLVTAADGDAGCTSKSIRDLALILEALLRTKSGTVLLDIINMNGLQMLHNILKQNRDHFIRRPIIRKLLKVLEFLASRGILTAEKINESPRCAGMESFRDSMLKLTRHGDKHVHHIAREFCDKWILPYMDGAASCSRHSYPSRRKRKSRWDYQPESHYKMVGLQIAEVYSGGHGESDLETSLLRNKPWHGRNWVTSSNHNDVPIMGGSTNGGTDDDVPPGFEPQQQVPPGFEPRQEERQQPAQACLETGGVAPGFCLGRYSPASSVSYGIPIALVQQLGTPEAEGTNKWKVAPGVPFNPSPPVSAFPRGSPCPSTSSTQTSRHDGTPSTVERKGSGCRGRGGRVDGNWRNGARTRLRYDHEGRRIPSNHHRLTPRPEEHGWI